MNCWLLLGMLLSTSLLAQDVTNAPPAAAVETLAPAATTTNQPSAKPAKKKAKKKSSAAKNKTSAGAELKTVPLVPGPAVVDANNVNVRGQAKLKSEVVGRLTKGQQVTVIEEITRNNSGPEEPSAWAKIYLPTNTHAWVNTSYIDPTNKTVRPKRLNVRSGPGENYSVLGRLQRGDSVTELGTKGDWTEIQPPTNAYAFVAAQYLKQEPAAAAAPAAVATTVPEAAPTTVTNAPEIAAAPVDTAATNAPAEPPSTNEVAEASTNTPPAAAADEPPPKRIVQREGLVRGTFSVQAPTHFELISPANGRTIDFLYTTSANLDLRRYKGLKIIVTGEEALDERWGNTPVITIQKIQVLEE